MRKSERNARIPVSRTRSQSSLHEGRECRRENLIHQDILGRAEFGYGIVVHLVADKVRELVQENSTEIEGRMKRIQINDTTLAVIGAVSLVTRFDLLDKDPAKFLARIGS